MNATIFERLCFCVYGVLGDDEDVVLAPDGSDDLESLGFDSLDVLDLGCRVRKEFGVDINLDDGSVLYKSMTLGDVVDFIEKAQQRKESCEN